MVNGVPKIADFGYSSCYIRAYEIRDTQLNHGNVMQYTLIINFIIADRLIQETVNYSLFHLMKSKICNERKMFIFWYSYHGHSHRIQNNL